MGYDATNCTVHYGKSYTINLGNYESTRIECSVSLETEWGSKDDAYGWCKDFVQAKLQEEVQTITGKKN